jgi:hypothetical protein
MGISTVGFGTTSVATTGTVFPPWPSGHDVGDIGIAFVETSGDVAASLSTPRGFAFMGSSISAGSGALTRLDVFWCRATSNAMLSPVFTGQADHQWAIMGAWRNCSTTATPPSVFSNVGGTNTLGTTLTMPAITTVVPGALAIYCAAYSADSSSNIMSSWTNANGNTLTPVSLFGTASGDGGGCAIAYSFQAAAGDTGTTSVTSAISTAYAPMTFSLRPLDLPNAGNFLPFFV